ncbi:MAG TPA: hypothetical protein DEA62_00645 [Coxiellaceae bacterium]|nr:hypothetical protein [Coxiellaceae bacterium]
MRIVRSEANKRKYFNINVDHCDGFEKFVRQLLPEIIPTCYLEGYSQLIEQVESLSWPTDPRFIFTGSNFDSDEIFKAWTASKANLGVPYYISQHGSDQTAIGYPPWPELIYCNKYFTWGWRNESQKIVPMFNFKIIKRRHVHKKIRDKLLLIQFHSPHLYGPEDLYYKIKVYRDIQFRFVDMLHSYIQEKLIVRLYHAHDPHDELIWQERFPNIYIEPGKANINELKNNSKIVVHSYDSTGIPESLGLNMPMVFLWAGKLSNIFPKAKPYYEKLRDAGIFADTPEQAAELVSLYWNDVDKWWNSKKVQDARKMFCDNYGRVVAKPLRLLKQHLLHDLNKEKY